MPPRRLSVPAAAMGWALLLMLVTGCMAWPSAHAAPPPLTAAEAKQWQDDLRVMSREMRRQHRQLFHTLSAADFDAAVQALEARIPSLARHQVIVEMARIAARVGDGHTNVSPTRDPRIGFRQLPVKLYFFADGLYVRAAQPPAAHLLGARVLQIGGVDVDQAYARVRPLIGRDNEMGARFFAPHLLAMPEVLHAVGLVDDPEQVRLLVERDGRQQAVWLAPAGPADMMPSDTDNTWSLRDGWTDARATGAPAQASEAPWLQHPDDKYWFSWLPQTRTVFVQLNQVTQKAELPVETFAAQLRDFVDAHPAQRLVLDLRLNRGGNKDFNRPLLRALVQLRQIDQPGRLFVLIGRGTFSAAQFLADDLAHTTNAVFIGEPTSGRSNSYGDSRRIVLPHSGITVRVSSIWWQHDERDRRPWRAPDIAAALRFEDYRLQRDPALQAAIDYAPRPTLQQLLEPAYAQGDMQEAQARLAAWRADPRNAWVDAEPTLVALGYGLLARGRTPLAIEVFRQAVALAPHSANAHDSLGEALAVAGEREAAIASYEQALQRDPAMPSAREALQRLRLGD